MTESTAEARVGLGKENDRGNGPEAGGRDQCPGGRDGHRGGEEAGGPTGPPTGIWISPTERWEALSSTPHLQTSFLPVTLRWCRGPDEAPGTAPRFSGGPACLGVPSARPRGPSRKPEKEGHSLTSECAHSQLWAQDRGLPAGVRGQVKVPRRQPAGLGGVGRDRGEAPGRMEVHTTVLVTGDSGERPAPAPCPGEASSLVCEQVP